jgi:hypothetical protein
MAAKPINQEISEAVVVDWRIGKLSIREIASKYGISKSAVGNICKGIDRDAAAIVDTGFQYRRGLQAYDGRMVDAIEDAVHDRVRFETQSNARMELAAQKAMDLLDGVDNPSAVGAVMNVLKTHREARLGKSPDTAIQINNNAPQVKTINDFYSNA